MRDLSFFLRLHAFLPLARFSTTHRKPYLPLEVRLEGVFEKMSPSGELSFPAYTWPGDDLTGLQIQFGTGKCIRLGPLVIEQPYTTQRSTLELFILFVQFIPILIISSDININPYLEHYYSTLMQFHTLSKYILYILSIFHIYKTFTTKKVILLDVLNIFLICIYIYMLNK